MKNIKPVIYPDIEVLYYYEPPYKKIKCIELGYENNFEEVWTQSVSDSELAIKRYLFQTKLHNNFQNHFP